MIRLCLALSLLIAALPSTAEQLSRQNAIRVQKAHQLSQEGQLSQAIENLRQIETGKKYDKAFIARMLGVFYWQNEQIDPAISQLKIAVESGQLKDDTAWVTERMLADLYLTQQSFENALTHYYALQKRAAPVSEKKHDLWFRIAQAHYQLEQWREVIPATQHYLALKPDNLINPLSLKLGAQLQLKQWKGAIPTLKQLIDLNPEKLSWWRQLAGLYMQVENHRAALDTLALAKLNGLPLSQQDRRLLAQLYAKRGIPERAALEISELKAATSDITLLAEQAGYWQMAKEWQKSLQHWQLAAELDAKYHWQAAQILLQQRNYQQALTTLNKVEGRQQQVALAKVRALFKLGELEKALIQAKNANAMKPSKQAMDWITYLSQLRSAS
ncbi:tetratricopeptide repeat protein [Vibrio sp. SCSIO 43137]|uniref:tetratricopeptide repeat protein n=1 Tax=Vibrio sp. SCSIO 43137 TaxID=3021011 RepID=UPI0023083125|nr:tetratricopeptide repeat protein [Vibrio sp. SCSIO 43137]WCE28858.1 hypothetical protein PK654_10865 [Vibrio sp. SCSIO 43137]